MKNVTGAGVHLGVDCPPLAARAQCEIAARDTHCVHLVQLDAPAALWGGVAHKQVERVVDRLDIVLPHRPAVGSRVLHKGVGHHRACSGHRRGSATFRMPAGELSNPPACVLIVMRMR